VVDHYERVQWLDEWPGWPVFVQYVENTLRMDRAVEENALPDRLAVDAPALLLTGTEGPSHLRDSVRAVHEALPDSRLVELDGVTHLGPVEAPERVVGAVRPFLDGIEIPV
jgi:pimeloyl-ACP methyl ester carboxylesterase